MPTTFALLQIVECSSKENIVEASVGSVHQQPHARFCTTIGEGENRYFPDFKLLLQRREGRCVTWYRFFGY